MMPYVFLFLALVALMLLGYIAFLLTLIVSEIKPDDPPASEPEPIRPPWES